MKIIFLAVMLFSTSFASAQIVYELPCPSGYDVNQKSFDSLTGKYRAFICINSATGAAIFNDGLASGKFLNGTASLPSIAPISAPTVGFFFDQVNQMWNYARNESASEMEFGGGNGLELAQSVVLTWATGSAGAGSTVDQGFTPSSSLNAGELDLMGKIGTTGCFTCGILRVSSLISKGTKFTITTNTCAATSTLGGASVGQFNSGTTGTCTVVITIGNTPVPATGWSCDAHDLTTPADVVNETATTPTTVTLSGTTVSADLINFKCIGY